MTRRRTTNRAKKRSGLPDFLTEFLDRHGKKRIRFRRAGFETRYLHAPKFSPEWWAEYEACLAGKLAARVAPGAKRAAPGTIFALIAAYCSSPEFLSLKASTQASYRGQISAFAAEHGAKRVALLQRQHIKAIVGRKSATPAAANNLLDRLKTLMRFAVDVGMRRDDPTLGVRGFALRSEGYHAWTEAEIATFEARHPDGTRARLAFALLLYTGQRRSDVVRMGWQHVSGARIFVVQEKTAARLELPMHPALLSVLAGTARDNLTFLLTAQGKPFSAAGFGNWFRDRCDEAGLPQCSAHGLRKAASRRLAEAGCSNQQIKAVTGHRTDFEVARYTAAADQARLAEQAIGALGGSKREQDLANHPEKGSQNDG